MKPASIKSALASVVFLLTVGIFAANAQPGAPVQVVNKPADPIPVAGTVDAKQNGTWTVGVSGTPTVKLDSTGNTVRLDPNGNTVKVERRENLQRVQTVNWTGQPEDAVTTNSTDLFSKVKVCIAHAAPNPIQVNVFSLLSDSFETASVFFTYDAFVINTPSTVCRTYDLPGVSVQVKITNTGNNNSGLSRFGIVFGN